MAQEWNLDFYKDRRGRVPATDFLDELDDRVAAKVTQDLILLRKHGLDLDTRWVKHLRNKIFELRTGKAKTAVRLLFAPVQTEGGRTLLMVVGFVKDTEKTPPKEIERAERRLKDWLSRQK